MSVLRLIADSGDEHRPRAELAESLVQRFSKETLAYALAFTAEELAGFRRLLRGPTHDAKRELKHMDKMMASLESLGREMRRAKQRRQS